MAFGLHRSLTVKPDPRDRPSIQSDSRQTLPGTRRARARVRVDGENRRKYPRAAASEAGVLVAQGTRAAPVSAPIRVSCVAPLGVGIEIQDDMADLCAPGAQVVLRFGAASLPFELPGEVVWLRRGDDVARVGVALRLEIATGLVRQGYAHWVVRRLTERDG